tara:strand:+ start:8145 stop:8567 length:423 start_codon:yes stop_codon:yes gene_type:complete
MLRREFFGFVTRNLSAILAGNLAGHKYPAPEKELPVGSKVWKPHKYGWVDFHNDGPGEWVNVYLNGQRVLPIEACDKEGWVILYVWPQGPDAWAKSPRKERLHGNVRIVPQEFDKYHPAYHLYEEGGVLVLRSMSWEKLA